MRIERPDRYGVRQTGPLGLLLVEPDPSARVHLVELCACTGDAARVIAEVSLGEIGRASCRERVCAIV